MLTQIGRFEILRTIARGGMGPVYLARDPDTDIRVVVKTVPEASDEVRGRLAREAELQARIHHRNVVRALEAGMDDGVAFVVTEYVAGESLATLLRRDPPAPLGDRLALVEQLCAGLAQIHAAGVVHRDIKPANLLVSIDGTLKIAEFGRARLGSEADTPDLSGTPAYMAPEQLDGGPVDFRSDLFAAGAVLYEAVALAPPFAPGGDQGGERSPQDSPAPLSSRVAGVDVQLARIVANAMERSPNRRYPSAEHLRRDVESARHRLVSPADTFSAGGGAEPNTPAIPSAAAEIAGPSPTGPAAAPAPAASGPQRQELERERAAMLAHLVATSRAALEAGGLEEALEAAERAAVLDPEHPLVRESIERAGAAAAQAERQRVEQARLATEAARHHAAQRRHQEEEEARRRADLEERRRAAEESRNRAEQEKQRLHAEQQEAQRRAEQEAHLRAEEERRRRARDEEVRAERAERDAERRRAEEERRRRQAAADARADASRTAEGHARDGTGQASSSLPPPGEAGRGGFDLDDLATLRHPSSPAAPRPVATGAPTPRQTDHREGITAVDDVQFTVYRPRAIRPETRRPMFVFTHLVDARHPQSQPAPIDEVRNRIAERLGPAAPAFRESMAEGRHGVPAGGQITLLPEVQGVTFTPERHAFRWELDIHEHRFEMVAAASLDGQVARGQLTVYLGAILLAEVPLAIRVDSTLHGEGDQAQERSTARAYRKIFASYSRRDAGIVEQFERYVAALGDSYLRDVRNLRAGEQWEDGLRRLIEEADVFQLFWSWNAMRSPNVRREWEYAISLNRPAFVRPTYWELPLPESAAEGLPPAALRQLHFHRMVAEVETDAATPAVQEDDSGAVRRREFEAPPRTEEARPSIAAEARLQDRLSVPAVYPVPSGPSAEPAAPSPVGPASRGRLLRFTGVAAGLMLTAIAGTLVWQNGMLGRGPTTATAPAPIPSQTPAAVETAAPAPPPRPGESDVPTRPVSPPPAQQVPPSVPSPPTLSPGAPAPPAAAQPGTDVADIRAVLTEFQRGYAERDARVVRRVWPSAPNELDAELSSARSYQVDIRDARVSVDGDTATVDATRNVSVQPRSGQLQTVTLPTTFSLRRTQGVWVIVEIR